MPAASTPAPSRTIGPPSRSPSPAWCRGRTAAPARTWGRSPSSAACAPYLLTMDGPAGYYIDRFDPAGVAPYVDWVNVMTYDFAGCWGMDHTGYNSPLLGSADDPDGPDNDDVDAVQAWIAAGLPAAK